MPELSALLSFLLTCAIIELTPGPNMAYLALLSATTGRHAGYAAAIGVALGLAVIGTIAALGLATLIDNSPLMFSVLRLAGVLYLLYLAYMALIEKAETSAGAISNETKHHASDLRYFKRGLITNLLNPKAAVFYIAILPTFITTGHEVIFSTLMLTAIYVTTATVIHLTIVSLAATTQTFLSDPKREKITRIIFALLLVCIAIWFAIGTSD